MQVSSTKSLDNPFIQFFLYNHPKLYIFTLIIVLSLIDDTLVLP